MTSASVLFNQTSTEFSLAQLQANTNWLSPLGEYSVLSITGADTKPFLQGQLSCDVLKLTNNQSTLGLCCTPKGEIVAQFRCFQIDEQTILLAAHQSKIETLKAYLAKYAVFSKVTLALASEHWLCLGTPIETDLHCQGLTLIPNTPSPLPDTLTNATLTNSHTWHAYQLTQGLYELETATNYLPEALNYDLTQAAISFTKGCYTGQEIIARMHYKGKGKHRLAVFTNHAPQQLSKSVITQQEQIVGEVIKTISLSDSTLICAVMQTKHWQKSEAVRIQDISFNALTLPYAIPE